MFASLKLGLAALTMGAVTFGGAAGWLWTRPMPTPFSVVQLQIAAGIALVVSRDEITTDIWNACHQAGACQLSFSQNSAMTPATGINPDDISQFTAWLNTSTNTAWRLPTVFEQRAFSENLQRKLTAPLFSDPRMAWAADYNTAKRYERAVFESGHFGALPNGLRDVGGNVWEWTSSCVNPAVPAEMCPAFFVGGDHEAEIPVFSRDAYSGGCSAGAPPTHLGFRLVRDV